MTTIGGGWEPGDDEEAVDDDWDWDTELGLLEPGPMLGPPEPPQPYVRWPAPLRPEDKQLAVLTPGGVGEFLRACRASAGFSQRELAELAGVPQSTVARIEAGRAPGVQLTTLVRLVEECDIVLVGTAGSHAPLLETDLAQRHRDGGDRMLPAHLANRPTPAHYDGWWADNRYTVQATRRRPARTHTRGFRYRDLPEQ